MERANEKLKALISLWQEKRGIRSMPSRGDLPVSVLRPWLGNLALIDLAEPTPYFRLCGTNLHSRFGGEMTRHKVDEVGEMHGRAALRAAIEKARTTHDPTQIMYKLATPGGAATFHELCLPLAHDGESADTVLFVSYAEQRR